MLYFIVVSSFVSSLGKDAHRERLQAISSRVNAGVALDRAREAAAHEMGEMHTILTHIDGLRIQLAEMEPNASPLYSNAVMEMVIYADILANRAEYRQHRRQYVRRCAEVQELSAAYQTACEKVEECSATTERLPALVTSMGTYWLTQEKRRNLACVGGPYGPSGLCMAKAGCPWQMCRLRPQGPVRYGPVNVKPTAESVAAAAAEA